MMTYLGRALLTAVAIILPLFSAQANNDEIQYGDVPSWVEAYPAIERSVSITEGSIETIYSSVQGYTTGDTFFSHVAYRLALRQPDALAAGNINLVWNPSTGFVTVNRLKVHRGDQVIDMLDTAKFRILQREGGLERAMLDGILTANLQIPGLRVGDEVEFAYTQSERSVTFPDKNFGAMFLQHKLAPGPYQMKLSWDQDNKPNWKASADIEPQLVTGTNSVTLNLVDPAAHIPPANAPRRYQIARVIQFSDFTDWREISRISYRLYEQAARLPDDKDLVDEIAKIRAEPATQKDRATAALALTQNAIRYVYTGMNGGNMTPASVTETWDRRFGDCKGKTAMLLGILSELGIEAEAVMVSTSGGDEINDWLPSPNNFDHILVRTVIDGRTYWLDGTRTGDARLLTSRQVPYRWVLPISETGETLESIAWEKPERPSLLEFVDIDATSGYDDPANVTFTRVIRSDNAIGLNTALNSIEKNRAIAELKLGMSNSWLTPDEADWEFNPTTGTLKLTYTGTTEMDWDIDEYDNGDSRFVSYFLPGGGFFPPPERKRPSEQDFTAPYVNDPGHFHCDVTRVRLPEDDKNVWALTSRNMDQTIAGITYFRVSSLINNEVRLVRSSRTVQHEISPVVARMANDQIDDFDNNKAQVQSFPKMGSSSESEVGSQRVPEFDRFDWMTEAELCLTGR